MTKEYSRKEMIDLYKEDHNIMVYAQAINNESRSRVDEIIAFAMEAGYKKIGIAYCVSVTNIARKLENVLIKDFDVIKVGCKIGGVPKSELIGVGWGSACNPIMQARILNDEETDLNIVMALCVGHDILFSKHSHAPTTTLIVKDERYNNNPNKGI